MGSFGDAILGFSSWVFWMIYVTTFPLQNELHCRSKIVIHMKILVACEFSGIVRDAFIRKGHDAWSCDFLPSEKSGNHIQGDVIPILEEQWDILIAHPPCTYLSRAGARWWKDPSREIHAKLAFEFVKLLANCNIQKIAIENPIGKLNKLWRYPDQTIQPWQFGHPYSKATCLWLKNLPLLSPT